VGTATASAQELLANVFASNTDLTPRYGNVLGNGDRKMETGCLSRREGQQKFSYE